METVSRVEKGELCATEDASLPQYSVVNTPMPVCFGGFSLHSSKLFPSLSLLVELSPISAISSRKTIKVGAISSGRKSHPQRTLGAPTIPGSCFFRPPELAVLGPIQSVPNEAYLESGAISWLKLCAALLPTILHQFCSQGFCPGIPRPEFSSPVCSPFQDHASTTVSAPGSLWQIVVLQTVHESGCHSGHTWELAL